MLYNKENNQQPLGYRLCEIGISDICNWDIIIVIMETLLNGIEIFLRTHWEQLRYHMQHLGYQFNIQN
jgi:hypothetical protein